MFDRLNKETRMTPNLTSALATARYSDYLAAAQRSRTAAGAHPASRFSRARSAWRARRAAPQTDDRCSDDRCSPDSR
jgi:hypothetical protein